MTPLQVTAELSDAVVYSGDLIHLDGILARGVFLGLTPGEQLGLPNLCANWAVDLDLPLARWTCKPVGSFDERLLDDDGMLWGWQASCEMDPWESHGTAEYRKRPPLGEMIRFTRDKTANIRSGALKAYDLSLPVVRAGRQRWYCVGDREIVYAALSRVTAIGRKHNTGYGTVRRWTVEECEHPGLLRRVYPASMATHVDDTLFERSARIRPPYHHRSRHVSRCLAPVIP